jgi:isopenicillin N synthase-like dioxygenase
MYRDLVIELPLVDMSGLLGGAGPPEAAGEAIDAACREAGFFYVTGHGIDEELQSRLRSLSHSFFALAEEEKAEIAMARAGIAWRGWFPVGGELTSGVPDMKEGIYFGSELADDDPRVRAGLPLHGQNLFPSRLPEMRAVVLDYLAALEQVGQALLGGMALALGLARDWFAVHLTADPVVLFRIFRYPAAEQQAWGVGEHTDYGLLTLLAQDEIGGLQVRTPSGWVDAEPRPGTLVCNIGDMLERLTGGRYRSTPHRVYSPSGEERLSFPFFLDPSWDAVVDRLPIVERPSDDEGAAERWDHTSVHGYAGTYGEYLISKVSRVFPELAAGL